MALLSVLKKEWSVEEVCVEVNEIYSEVVTLCITKKKNSIQLDFLNDSKLGCHQDIWQGSSEGRSNATNPTRDRDPQGHEPPTHRQTLPGYWSYLKGVMNSL